MTKLSFKLVDDFVEPYKTKEPPFGFKDAGGNSIGEITLIRTYSRIKEDGAKERWWEICRRVIEGMYSIQKDHALKNRLPWNANKAQASAKEAFDRMFNLQWTPPGRGLWVTGTEMIHERNIVAGLYNCAFVSTGDMDRHDPGAVFAWVMDSLMLGIGTAYDTRGKNKNIFISERTPSDDVFVIPDSREGWAESLRLLVNSYLRTNKQITFDYSEVRPYGEPIKGFGGTASGPEPLMKIHNQISDIFESRIGEKIDSRLIVDIMNLIGTCVVAGNVRRCLPGDAPIQTDRGIVFMKDINVGDSIVTGGVRSNVTAKVNSGVQDVYTVRHRFGSFKATANHRVAVFFDVDKFNYKTVAELELGDRIVFDGYGVDYGNQAMPQLQEELHFNASEFYVPETVNEDVAWLIGMIHGDGHTGTGVEIATASHELESLERAKSIIEENFGLSGNITQIKNKNALRLRVHSRAFGRWLQENVKIANQQILVPDFIAQSSRSVRQAYLAGVFDSDGRMRQDGPIQIAATIYSDFAESLSLLLSTIGIASVVSERLNNNNRVFYTVDIVGNTNKLAAEEILEYSCSGKTKVQSHDSPVDFSYAYDTVRDYNFSHHNRASTVATIKKSHEQHSRHYPSPVLSVEHTSTEETWDIEVDDIHRFTAYGVVMHNSAELALGSADDEEFLNLKNYDKYPERAEFGWMSNNTVVVDSDGYDYESAAERIADNGEPGFLWIDTMRKYGRLGDPVDNKDHRALGTNPCAEISLESYELCNLVEIHLHNHDSVEDFLRTIKFAYLYAKSITLLPTHWPQTNAVIQRNRRIGTSITGIAGFVDHHGLSEFRKWADEGYQEIQKYDETYSEWLGVRESIRTTTVKPSGSVSLLSGSTPGVHWPAGGQFYKRAIRFASNDPLLELFVDAGYDVEKDMYSENTFVVYFPVKTDMKRSEKDVSIYEKIHLAAEAQRVWSDNSVSVTVTFDKEKESGDLSRVLRMYEGELKTVSFLPMSNDVYPQMPYTEITEEKYNDYLSRLEKIDFSAIYDGSSDSIDAAGEKYCSTSTCEI